MVWKPLDGEYIFFVDEKVYEIEELTFVHCPRKSTWEAIVRGPWVEGLMSAQQVTIQHVHSNPTRKIFCRTSACRSGDVSSAVLVVDQAGQLNWN